MEFKQTKELISRIEELESQLAEAQQHIEAIKAGEVSAFVLNRNNRAEVFALESVDYAYRILIENFREGALNISEDGMIVYTNTYFHQLLGLTYEEVISTSIFDFIHPESLSDFKLIFKQGLADQAKGEINLMAKGKIIPVYVSLTSLYPTLPMAGMIITDLSEKKQFAREVEVKKSLQNILRQAPAAIAVIEGGPHYKHILGNTHYQKLVSRTEEELIGKSLREVFSDPQAKETIQVFERVFKSGEAYVNAAHPFTTDNRSDGTRRQRYFNISIEPIRAEDGKINSLMFIAFEITEQIEAQQKIEESEKVNRQFAAIVQSSEEAIISKTLDGIVTSWNPGAEKIFGYTAKEMIGETISKLIPKERQQEEPRIIMDISQGKSVEHYETKRQTKEGRLIDVLLSISPIRDNEGNVTGVSHVARDITVFKKASEALKQSEEKFRLLFNSMDEGFCIIEFFDGPHGALSDYIHIQANPAYTYNTGIPDIIGQKVRTMVPDEADAWVEIYRNVLLTGKPVRFERELKATKRHLELSAFRIEPAELKQVAVLFKDVTERKRVEGIIRRSEAFNRTVLESSPDCVKVLDAEGRLQFMNANGMRIMEIDDFEPFKNKLWVESWGEENRKLVQDAIVKSINGKTAQFQAFRPTAKGTPKWWDVMISPVQQPGSEVVTSLIAVSRDITHQMESHKKIEQSEKELRQITETIPQMVWVCNEKGEVIYFNEQWYNYTGTNEREMMGHQWLSLVHPEDVAPTIEKWNNAQQTLTPVSVEYRLRSAKNHYHWVLSVGRPIFDDHGNLQKWFGACTFIDEQKEFSKMLEEKVAERTNELQKMNKELQSFAYISSHDLQEPLRKIQTFSTQILEKEISNLTDAGKEKFKRMQSAAKRMQTLINDLLAYSRTNISERKFEKTDLNKIIEQVKDDLKEELKLKQATVEACHLNVINIIPFQFRQLMQNLISNALKFSKPDTPPNIIIKSEIIRKGDEFWPEGEPACHITIADNGIGFESQYQDKIFEVFQRLHGRNEYTGTGIGLAIVKKIVENHNGIIKAKGELDKGAIFHIYIPV